MSDSPWPPPSVTPDVTSGWYLASDGHWYLAETAPAPGYVLASDGRWYHELELAEPWRRSYWGLGDVWWGVLVFLIASIAGGIVVAIVMVSTDSSTSFEEFEFGPYSTAGLVIVNVLAFAGVPWLASRRKGLASLRQDFGLALRPIDVAIGLGAGIAGVIAASLVGTGVDQALGADESSGNVPFDSLDGIGPFLAFFVAVAIVTPVIEELFFRGLLYRSLLKRGRGPFGAIAITTSAFVLPHLPAAESWVELASLAASIGVLGLTFNLVVHWTKNRLGAAIVGHLIVNSIAVVLLYVS